MFKDLIEKISHDFLSDTCLPMVKFPVTGKDVTFLTSPSEFFDAIIDGIATSKRRIYLSSLYLGSTKVKEALLLKSIKRKLKKSPSCKIHLHLDRCRSRRPGPSSILSFLQGIKEPQFTCALYQTDSVLAKLSPPILREVWALSHMKVCVFDDSVLVSGANLSEEYFTIKQDRYSYISSEGLGSFFQELLDILAHISYSYHLGEERPPSTDDRTIIPLMIGKLFHKYSKDTTESAESATTETPSNQKTFLIPVLQMAPLLMSHDPLFIANIMRNVFDVNCMEPPTITLSSAYYNPAATKRYFGGNGDVDPLIITASMKSNSFYEAKGIKGVIPFLYNSMALQSIPSNGGGGINFYTKEGHYFHGKGLWFSFDGRNCNSSSSSGGGSVSDNTTKNKNATKNKNKDSINKLSVMAIGSSNYGNRSLTRDLECQLYFITESKDMLKKIDDDLGNLLKHCHYITKKDLNSCNTSSSSAQDDTLWHRMCSYLLSSFL